MRASGITPWGGVGQRRNRADDVGDLPLARNMTTPNAALEALLNADDWSLPSPPTPVIAGDDPILPTRFRIGAAAGAAIAAVGVAANQLWAARGGRSQQLGIEIEAVAAALRSETFLFARWPPGAGGLARRLRFLPHG